MKHDRRKFDETETQLVHPCCLVSIYEAFPLQGCQESVDLALMHTNMYCYLSKRECRSFHGKAKEDIEGPFYCTYRLRHVSFSVWNSVFLLFRVTEPGFIFEYSRGFT